MTGKEKCRILKEIRAEIAKQNDINLVVEECTHKGECRGTCPRCESEVRYLENELERRRKLKKKVAVAGISAGMTMALSGCAAIDALVDSPLSGAIQNAIYPKQTVEPADVVQGEVVYFGDVDLKEDDLSSLPDPYEVEIPEKEAPHED